MTVAAAALVLAFVRQLLIAAYFGASRSLEIYLVVYAVANWVGFALGIALDSVAVIHLVRGRERTGTAATGGLGPAAFRASGMMGLAAAALMVPVTFVLTPVVATGFTGEEQAAMVRLAVDFLPWICVLLPYYAAAARHKSEWRFYRVFLAEIMVGAVSIAWLVADHDSIHQLPFAYCAGYGVALLSLLPGSGLIRRAGRSPIGLLLRDVGELYVANQTGNVPGIVDRHFQSLIHPGGIAAIGYASQLLMGLSSLIGMREIFIVPLSETERRNERIERLIAGMLLVSVPLAGAVSCFSPELVRILFERGRFGASATDLTASVLRILVLGLAVGAITTPLARVLQIVQQIRLMHIYYLALAIFLLAAGGIFIGWLHWGAQGIAVMNLAAGAPAAAVLVFLVARCGIVLRWRQLAVFFLVAALASSAAAVLGLGAASGFAGAWPRLFSGGPVYAAVVAGSYFLVRRRLFAMLR